ncbi:MAG TPA: hypothetical protein VMB05_04965 [Solirubrobacteraceae bacterium]|nr:hypothetical protein [Solirubrobacteraceae bacterium]
MVHALTNSHQLVGPITDGLLSLRLARHGPVDSILQRLNRVLDLAGELVSENVYGAANNL